MKVLLVSQEYPPETGWGGIGTYVAALAPALVAAGAEVHVLSVVMDQATSDRTDAGGVHVHRRGLRAPRGVGRITRLPISWGRLRLARAVRAEAAALGVTFDVAECPDWYAEGLLLPQDLPVVVRLHSSGRDVFRHRHTPSIDERLAMRIEDRQLRRARLITGTHAQLETHAPFLRRHQIPSAAVMLPVPLVEVTPPPEGPPTICFIGRFEARKDPETALRAFAALRRRIREARLVLRGRDTDDAQGRSTAERLRALAGELAVADAVELHDRWADGPEVLATLRAATVCIVPSRWESFGYVAAEAAAAGRPVVASDLPALADVVQDGVTGRLAPAGDPEGFAEALADVLQEPDRARSMGTEAARRIRLLCAPEVVAAQTLDVYERAIANSGEHTPR